MALHTFDAERADKLADVSRYRFCSRETLHALVAPDAGMTLADLGSGIGFYTDDLAPYVDTCYGVDVQTAMHELYRERGVPDNVELVTAEVADLPFDDDSLDAAFSTMTYHEFATEESFAELSRVLAPGGRLVTVDWDGDGEGRGGPPLDSRYDLTHAVELHVDHGFTLERAEGRPETFVCVGRLPE